MRPALHLALGAVVVAACVLAAARPGAVAAENGETVATVLYPGWNMAGWLGGDAPVSAIFNEVPALRAVAAWDAAGRRYVWAGAGRPEPELRALTTGMGLWLDVGGEVPVTWEQRPDAAPVLLELRAGRNLVVWTGEDGAKVGDATARLAPALLGASRWNAAAGRTEAISRDGTVPRAPLRTLGRGDALWVDMQRDARWYQSGTARTVFEYPDDLPRDQRSSVERGVADVLAFFAERHAIEPPPFTVVVEHDLDVYAGVLGRRLYLSASAAGHEAVARTLAHEYFHIVQGGLAGANAGTSPAWIVEGAAVFAETVYTRARYGSENDRIRDEQYRLVSRVPGELAGLEDGDEFHDVGAPAYGLGALAVEWLVGHAWSAATGSAFAPLDAGWSVPPDADSHIAYHRLLASAGGWEEAFAQAFGIAPAAFYPAFERYRADLVPQAQLSEAPVIAVGEVPSGSVARVEAEVEAVRALLVDRFGLAAAAYTAFVVPGPSRTRHGEGLWPLASVPERSSVSGASSPPCLGYGAGWVVYRADCTAPPGPDAWLDVGIGTLIEDRAASLDPPAWLDIGGAAYLAAAHRAERSSGTLAPALAAFSAIAASAPVDLRSLSARAVWATTLGRALREAWAVLAVDWLVQRAGEHALVEYWRLLSDVADAPGAAVAPAAEAFERAFGLAPGDFYARFAADHTLTGHRLAVASDAPRLDPSVPGWEALVRDHLVATRSVVLDAAGRPVRAGWVVMYGRVPGDGGVLAGAAAGAIAHTDDGGGFDVRAGVTPRAWAVIADGCRYEGSGLSVKRSIGGAYIIHVLGDLGCGAATSRSSPAG
ncbi:MAG: hypothetical protein OXG95_00285 [Chloroflexi bacterium]|nr:hypothetical protein [Chloroflexota bacterium]